MSTTPTTAEKMRRLPWSIGSDAANTVFAQLTYFGSVFVLFLSELDFNKFQIGFLLSLIPFSGLIALFTASAISRFGYKRTYLIFYGARKAVTIPLLATPWVLAQFGSQATLFYVAGVVAVFSIVRAVAITAIYPWTQEYVPSSVRGKYSAVNNICATLSGLIAVTGAGYVIERSSGLNGFMVLFAIGLVFGFISVWAAAFIPGGAPAKEDSSKKAAYQEWLKAIQDKDFFLYLTGVGLVTIVVTALGSFVPLFMQEEVGLSSGNIVLLQTGTMLGGLLSTFLWGWAADRYGSKPVTLSGVYLTLLLPALWMLMPRQSGLSLYVALGIALLQGLADMAWIIGSARLLFVNVVPPEKKVEYMAVFYAWVSIVGGASQLFGGRILDLTAGVRGQFLFLTIDPYTILFVTGLILPVISIILLRNIGAEKAVSEFEFAGLFMRGNPFVAAESLIRYHLAKDELTTIRTTERLGQAKSRLAVDELLEALADPRFNVRFEAIISISRMPPDPRLVEALIKILNGSELALSVIAAWALGRIGDPTAFEALRKGLDSPYRSIQAHSIRALGSLGNEKVAPVLLRRLRAESDKGLQMAYASALGKLGVVAAIDDLLKLLQETQNEGARMELALSLARMVGDERHFVQLWRSSRAEAGTVLSGAVSAFKKKMGRNSSDKEVLKMFDACADALAANNIPQGVTLLQQALDQLPLDRFELPRIKIIRHCRCCLEDFDPPRMECLLLLLNILTVGWPS